MLERCTASTCASRAHRLEVTGRITVQAPGNCPIELNSASGEPRRVLRPIRASYSQRSFSIDGNRRFYLNNISSKTLSLTVSYILKNHQRWFLVVPHTMHVMSIFKSPYSTHTHIMALLELIQPPVQTTRDKKSSTYFFKFTLIMR